MSDKGTNSKVSITALTDLRKSAESTKKAVKPLASTVINSPRSRLDGDLSKSIKSPDEANDYDYPLQKPEVTVQVTQQNESITVLEDRKMEQPVSQDELDKISKPSKFFTTKNTSEEVSRINVISKSVLNKKAGEEPMQPIHEEPDLATLESKSKQSVYMKHAAAAQATFKSDVSRISIMDKDRAQESGLSRILQTDQLEPDQPTTDPLRSTMYITGTSHHFAHGVHELTANKMMESLLATGDFSLGQLPEEGAEVAITQAMKPKMKLKKQDRSFYKQNSDKPSDSRSKKTFEDVIVAQVSIKPQSPPKMLKPQIPVIKVLNEANATHQSRLPNKSKTGTISPLEVRKSELNQDALNATLQAASPTARLNMMTPNPVEMIPTASRMSPSASFPDKTSPKLSSKTNLNGSPSRLNKVDSNFQVPAQIASNESFSPVKNKGKTGIHVVPEINDSVEGTATIGNETPLEADIVFTQAAGSSTIGANTGQGHYFNDTGSDYEYKNGGISMVESPTVVSKPADIIYHQQQYQAVTPKDLQLKVFEPVLSKTPLGKRKQPPPIKRKDQQSNNLPPISSQSTIVDNEPQVVKIAEKLKRSIKFKKGEIKVPTSQQEIVETPGFAVDGIDPVETARLPDQKLVLTSPKHSRDVTLSSERDVSMKQQNRKDSTIQHHTNQLRLYRDQLRNDFELNQLRREQNQYSFKNLVSPEVTKHNYTIVNNNTRKQNFYFGQSQSPTFNKDDIQSTLMTNTFDGKASHNRSISVRDPPSQNKREMVSQSAVPNNLSKLKKPVMKLQQNESQRFHFEALNQESQSILSPGLDLNRINTDKMLESFNSSPRDTFQGEVQLREQSDDKKNSLFLTYLQHSGVKQKLNQSSVLQQQSKTVLRGPEMLMTEHNTQSQKSIIKNARSVRKSNESSSDEEKVFGKFQSVTLQKRNLGQTPQASFGAMPVSSSSPIVDTMSKKSSVVRAQTGASVGSSAAKFIARYQQKQPVYVFEDGQSLTETSPVYKFDVTSQIMKYYVYQDGSNPKDRNPIDDFKAQNRLYRYAIEVILDEIKFKLSEPHLLEGKDKANYRGQALKKFDSLFTLKGNRIKSLTQIPPDCTILVAGLKKRGFQGLKADKLFQQEEMSYDMLDRVIQKSFVAVDNDASNLFSDKEDFLRPIKKNPKILDFQSDVILPTPIKSPVKTPTRNFESFASKPSPSPIQLLDPSSDLKKLKLGLNHAKSPYFNDLPESFSDSKRNQIKARHFTIDTIMKIPRTETERQAYQKERNQKTYDTTYKGSKDTRLPPIEAQGSLNYYMFGKQSTSVKAKQRSRKVLYEKESTRELDSQYQELLDKTSGGASSVVSGSQKHAFRSPRASRDKEQEILAARNLLRDRSPSYHYQKLAASKSPDATPKLSYKEQKDLEAAMTNHKIQNEIVERQKWKQLYHVNDQQLFDMFSEFTAMMMIARQRTQEKNPKSVAQIQKSTIKNDVLNDVFPVDAKLNKYLSTKSQEQHLAFKLSKKDMYDYTIPVPIFIEYQKFLRQTKPELQRAVLGAVGVPLDSKRSKVQWEHFMKLKSVLNFNLATTDEYISFLVHLFDPYERGYTRDYLFEQIIDSLFMTSEEEKEIRGKKDDSEDIGSNLKKICYEEGIVVKGKYLDPNKLRVAFTDKKLDIEIFKQALK